MELQQQQERHLQQRRPGDEEDLAAAGVHPPRRHVTPTAGHWRRSWRGGGGGGGGQGAVGGLRAVRNGLAIKEIFLRSQQRGTYVTVDPRDGSSVAANRARASLAPKEAMWTLEIFKVNERAELELKASRELLDKDLLALASHTSFTSTGGAHHHSSSSSSTPHSPRRPGGHDGGAEDAPCNLSTSPSGHGAPSPRGGADEAAAEQVFGSPPSSAGFLPTDVDDSELAAENVDVMYYFGFRSPLGRYLGLETVGADHAKQLSALHTPSAPTSITTTATATPHPHPHHHQHHSSYPTYPSYSTSNPAVAPSMPAAGTPGSTARGSRSPRSRIVTASAEEPNFDCLWVCYQIRRGVWGLKSQRGDGPWLGVEGETGEMVLLDDPLPADARFFWGFTTVRKRIKLLSSQGRYLSAELNRTVTANRERAGQWETWIMERLPSNKFTLLGYHGFYLSGLNDGTVCANQGLPKETEQWELVQIRKGVFSLKSVYSRYLCITPEKDGRVVSQPQSGLKAKRLDEWTVQKDYHLRKITKSLIPLSSVADIPLPASSPPVPTAGSAVLATLGIKTRKVSFPPATASSHGGSHRS